MIFNFAIRNQNPEHLRGIFRYLTSEKTAGIGDFDDFCALSKYSGEVDRCIFHRGGLGTRIVE